MKKNDAASSVRKQLVWSGLVWSGRVEPDVHDRPLCKVLTESPSPITFLDCVVFLLLGSNQSARNSFLSVLFCFLFLFSGFVLLFFGARAVLDQCQSRDRDVLATFEICGDEPNSRSCRKTQEIDGSATCTVIRDAQNPCREL